MLAAPGREEPRLAAAGNTPLCVSVSSAAAAAAAGECGSVRCSHVGLLWLILSQAQVAINMLLMLPKLVIEEILL